MPDDTPWTADVQHVYETLSDHHALTSSDASQLRSHDFSVEFLRDAFEEGWMQTSYPDSESPQMTYNPDVSPEDRTIIRETVLYYMHYLGYDNANEFWDEWREWAGY